MSIIVFAGFRPKPGDEAEVEAILRGMVVPTRSEAGCRRYDLYRSADGKRFHLFEIYDDEAALDHHRSTGHYKSYRAQIADLLAEPITVQTVVPVDVSMD